MGWGKWTLYNWKRRKAKEKAEAERREYERVNAPSYKRMEECVDLIHTLTDYPKDVVKDVLIAYKVYLTEMIRVQSLEVEEGVLDQAEVYIPCIGKLGITPLYAGRTDEIMYKFDPSEEFIKDVKKAYYEGESATEELVKQVMYDKIRSEYGEAIHKEIELNGFR